MLCQLTRTPFDRINEICIEVLSCFGKRDRTLDTPPDRMAQPIRIAGYNVGLGRYAANVGLGAAVAWVAHPSLAI